jgi:hypothetical protein
MVRYSQGVCPIVKFCQSTAGIQISHDMLLHLSIVVRRVLAAYVVFAVADSYFHFTPEKSYISSLSEMIRGAESSVTAVPVPTETIAPVLQENVDAVKALLDQ